MENVELTDSLPFRDPTIFWAHGRYHTGNKKITIIIQLADSKQLI